MWIRPAILVLTALIIGAAGAKTGATLLDNGEFRKFTGGGRIMRWRYSSRCWHALEGVGVKGSRAMVYDNPTAMEAGMPSQQFEIAPGGRYVLEADVLIEGVLPGGKGAGALLRAEWMDADKVRLDGVTAGPIASTQDDWLHLSVTTRVVQAEAVMGKVEFGVTPGCAGKVIFDNVKFSRWLPERLQMLECSAKDGEAGDGMVEFTAKLDLADENAAAWKGNFCWRGADGRVHVDEPAMMDNCSATITLAVRDMAFGQSSVAFVLVKPNGEIAARRELTFKRTVAPR